MQNAKCKIQNAKCKMQNAKCKMQNASVKDSTITIDPCYDVIVLSAACASVPTNFFVKTVDMYFYFKFS